MTTSRTTFDQLAIRALLKGDEAARITKAARIAIGDVCPGCDATDTDIEDNGFGEFRCVACDHRWGEDAA